MVRTAVAETLGAGVYEQLRADVLGGLYSPGERLRPVELASRFGVGAGVVREALTRLAEQRLLIAEPNRGYRVMSISAGQIAELVELRRVTECAALRLSVERCDLDWEGRVLAAHQALAEPLDPGDPDGMSLAHKNFHQALVSGCGNPRLVALCEELFQQFLMVCFYPQHPFGFMARLVLFTVFPAAFVGLLPVEAVRDGDIAKALAIAAGALVYAALAAAIFARGLRRYASGNRLVEWR